MSANYVRNPSRSVVRHSKKELMPSIAWPLKEIWRLYVFGFIRPLFRELESLVWPGTIVNSRKMNPTWVEQMASRIRGWNLALYH